MRFLLASLLLIGCQASSAKIRMVPNVVAGKQASLDSSAGSVAGQSAALRIGSPSAMNLKSLKYFISSIQLCQDVQVQGTAFSAANGCIQLYQGTQGDDAAYQNYVVEQAEADNDPSHYIDLMTAEGQATLRHPVTLEVQVGKDGQDAGESPTGAYRFGLINFFRPIKVTAEFPVLGSSDQYFRTRAVTQTHLSMTPDGRFNTEKVEIGDTLSGPTEETTYMLNNGGTLFTFQKPFVVTQADVDAQADIMIDLVFNPENFGQAYESQNCTDDQYSAICDPLNNVVIDMPYVRMNPVPRKTGEKTRKETYLMDYDTDSKLRIELYYNDADPEAGIQGVDSAVVYESTAQLPDNNVIASNYVSQTGSVTTHDANVTLMDYSHTPNLDGLIRRQDGTLMVHCLFTGSVCPTTGGSVERAYQYMGDSVVSTD
ncbi:MAG TPA: hypothetical protein VGI70_00750 [Polyangiales bacterium]